MRMSSTRKDASGPRPRQNSSNDVRSCIRTPSERKNASDPGPLQSPSNDVRSRMRMLSKSENARAILLAVGLVAFFALALQYGDSERKTSVPACDSDLCGSPVPNAAVAGTKLEEIPIIGGVQNDDEHRQPAPGADKSRQPVPESRHPAPDAKRNMAGIVTSRKTGARARVGVAHAARFQTYVDDLESNHGARILFMGGIRPGRCSSSGLHPCGKALDVCQLRRGVVDPRCRLPPRRKLAQIASSHGLFEGGRWCNSDYGHVQLVVTAGDCGHRGTRIARRQMPPEAGRDAAVASFD